VEGYQHEHSLVGATSYDNSVKTYAGLYEWQSGRASVTLCPDHPGQGAFMKLPWLRHKQEAPAEPAPMASTVDFTLPRMVFYRTVETDPMSSCPRCGTTLSPETGVYFVATRQGGRQGENFMMSGDFGFYCPACPTVVVDPEELGQYFYVSAQKWDVGDAYVVLGLIDLDAIPEEQRHVPIDERDALPFVPFEPGDRPPWPHKQHRRKPRSRRKKRR
jgi:hypothetical protein